MLKKRLDAASTQGENNGTQDQPVAAQPVEPEDRPLQIGDRFRITSRQLFGVVGILVHSTISQHVRISVEGRRCLVIRSPNNLQRIN